MSKKFPDDFDYIGIPTAKQRSEEDIAKDVQWIKKKLKEQERECPDDYTPFMVASGNTIVFGFRSWDCKNIYVCQDYHEMQYAYKE